LFIVLLAGTWLWQRYDEKKAVEEPTSTPAAMLLEVDTNLIRDMKIEDAGGNRIYLRRLGGSWIMTEPERQNVDAEIMSGKMGQLAVMQPISTLNPPPAESEIGLDPPAYTITLTDESGNDTVMEVGAHTPTQSGYYLRMAGTVYVVSTATIDEIVGMLANPPVPVPTATSTGTITPQAIISGTLTVTPTQVLTATP
jgi:hypothetical protein